MKKKKSKDRGPAQELADVVTHVQGVSFKTFEDRFVSLSPPPLSQNYLLLCAFDYLCVCVPLCVDGEQTKMKKKKSKDRGLAQELADVVTHVQGVSFKTIFLTDPCPTTPLISRNKIPPPPLFRLPLPPPLVHQHKKEPEALSDIDFFSSRNSARVHGDYL